VNDFNGLLGQNVVPVASQVAGSWSSKADASLPTLPTLSAEDLALIDASEYFCSVSATHTLQCPNRAHDIRLVQGSPSDLAAWGWSGKESQASSTLRASDDDLAFLRVGGSPSLTRAGPHVSRSVIIPRSASSHLAAEWSMVHWPTTVSLDVASSEAQVACDVVDKRISLLYKGRTEWTLTLAGAPVCAGLAVREYWVNSDGGMKHGFLLDAAPDLGAVASVVVRSTVAAGVDSPFVHRVVDGACLPVLPGHLDYCGLVVVDGAGSAPPSSMSLRPHDSQPSHQWLDLQVGLPPNASSLRFPLDIDPTVVTHMKQYTGGVNASFGYSIGTPGDIHNDGYDDIVIGCPAWDGGEEDEGRVFLYRGAWSPSDMYQDWFWESDLADAQVGWSVSPRACNVNGDAYGDIIVGQPGWSEMYMTARLYRGRALIFKGNGVSAGISPWYSVQGTHSSRLGEIVTCIGDADANGKDDWAIGLPRSNSYAGIISVFLTSSSGTVPPSSSRNLVPPASTVRSGTSVCATDVNGDGYADIVSGAPLHSTCCGRQEGGVYIHLGSSAGPSFLANQTVDGPSSSGAFGTKVVCFEDVNLDGYGDIAVFEEHTNSVYVYHGSASGIVATVATKLTGATGSRFGEGLANAGDVNADGMDDLIVGAPGEDRAYVYYGTADAGIDESTVLMTALPAQEEIDQGYVVGRVGDVNGDGDEEFAVVAANSEAPAPAPTVNKPKEGKVSIYGGLRIPTPAPTPYPTASPTSQPTPKPTAITPAPSPAPTPEPTPEPTPQPTMAPTTNPTPQPTPHPTPQPTSSPTLQPTSSPTPEPTPPPTSSPTPRPTAPPTPAPTPSPTALGDTHSPTASPTPNPTPTAVVSGTTTGDQPAAPPPSSTTSMGGPSVETPAPGAGATFASDADLGQSDADATESSTTSIVLALAGVAIVIALGLVYVNMRRRPATTGPTRQTTAGAVPLPVVSRSRTPPVSKTGGEMHRARSSQRKRRTAAEPTMGTPPAAPVMSSPPVPVVVGTPPPVAAASADYAEPPPADSVDSVFQSIPTPPPKQADEGGVVYSSLA
jgi:hypothetical protein